MSLDKCDLCCEKISEGTIIELNPAKYLNFCKNCRREVTVQLIRQYLLEVDTQPDINDMLHKEIEAKNK